MGSCCSLVQSSRDTGEESKTCGGPATPQLSVGSTEDESGFSSMSSFHEVGLPEMTNGSNGAGSFHELGLPIVETQQRHRRWSSTPVEHNYPQREALRVLWVWLIQLSRLACCLLPFGSLMFCSDCLQLVFLQQTH